VPALSPGPELPGPPPTLCCPGEHCLSPAPGEPAMAGRDRKPEPTYHAYTDLTLCRCVRMERRTHPALPTSRRTVAAR
jgi:hypothetical protein